MKHKVIASAAGGALLLAGAYAWREGDIVVKSDPGGDVRALYAQYYADWEEGKRHVIDGRCASACTMRLVFPNTCVTPNARLGFHRTYYVSFFGWKIGSAWGDQFMLDRYPEKIREWIKPRISHDMTWLSSDEAVQLGVKAC